MISGKNRIKMTKPRRPTAETLLTEYSVTNDVFVHFDNYSWQVGTVLIASVFIFWGFLISSENTINSYFVIVGSTLVNLLTSLWMLYADHNRQIVLSKLHRMHEIETLLGMKQHLRWIIKAEDGRPIYRTYGIKGHVINLIIYFITSLGTPMIGILKYGYNSFWLIPILLCFVVAIWVSINELKIRNHLRKIQD